MYPKKRTDDIPANTIRRTNVDMMLVHSLRCWPNIISRLIQLLVIQLWSSKHKTFVYYLHNVGPTSSTLAQHCINVMQMFCVYLDVSILPAQSVGPASARRYHNPRPIVCYSPDDITPWQPYYPPSIVSGYPNTRHRGNAGSKTGQRLWQCASIQPACTQTIIGSCIAFCQLHCLLSSFLVLTSYTPLSQGTRLGPALSFPRAFIRSATMYHVGKWANFN